MRWLPYILSLPALIVCIGILIPFVTAVYYSMLRYRLNLPALKGFIWFNNYISFLSDSEFWNTVRVSLLYTGLTVGVEVLFGLTIALLLQKRTVFNNLASVALLLPLMTAPALAALMWKLMTNPNFGVLSYLVQSMGVSNFKWASSPNSALFTVVLVDAWVYTPFIMILLLAGLRSLPTQPFEAAALDGVPRRFVFFRITLPMLLPYLLTAALVSPARRHPAVRHHLSDDPGRTRQHASGVPGARLSRILFLHERRQVGDAAGDPVGDHLRAVERLRQTTSEAARTRARPGLRGPAMDHASPLERTLRAVAVTAILIFFLFPIFWIFLMSFQTNEDILRIPPSVFFKPTLSNYQALITGQLQTTAGNIDIAFMQNLWNSVLLSTVSVALALLLGVPAAYAFARYKFPLSEDIAFTLLSFRFAPPLLVLLPLSLYYQQIGLTDTYVGLIWVYQLIALPLILWIVRGYFEDISPDIESAYRVAGHSWISTFTAHRRAARRSGHRGGGAARLHLLLEQFRLRAGAGFRRQAAGDGRRARLRHGLRHSIWPDRGRDRAVDHPDPGDRPLGAALSG